MTKRPGSESTRHRTLSLSKSSGRINIGFRGISLLGLVLAAMLIATFPAGAVTDDDSPQSTVDSKKQKLISDIANALRKTTAGEVIEVDGIQYVDMNNWMRTGPGSATWNVETGGRTVLQTVNGDPTFYVSSQEYRNLTVQGTIKVNDTSDDDWIGFVLAYKDPQNTSSDQYEFILFDWKKADQSGAYAGYSISDVNGQITLSDFNTYFWNHTDTGPSGVFDVLNTDFGDKGWAAGTTYYFRILYLPTRIKVMVNDVTIFDVSGTFQDGRIGFYNYSQADVQYGNVQIAPGSDVERAPVATDDSYGATVNTQLVVDKFDGILSNDFDYNLDSFTINLESDVSHGTLALAADGSFTYDATTDYEGYDYFTYTINDDDGSSEVATVTIAVQGTNEAPTDISLSHNTVSAGAANGSTIGTFTTTDPNTIDSHDYLLVDNCGGRFGVVGNKLVVADSASMVVGSSYNITVRSTDIGGLYYDKVFSITVSTTTPTVGSPTSTNITYSTAELGGMVSSDGGQTVTARGVVWGLTANPTLAGNAGSASTSGGTGTFTVNASSLAYATTYHYRAYGTNSHGTSYSADATFTTATPPFVTITVTQSANGTITPGTSNVNIGNDITFTITPDTGFHVTDVLVDGSSVGAVTSYKFTNVTAAHTLTATYAVNYYSIYTSAGPGGTISPSGTPEVKHGKNITFAMTPDAGYAVADVKIDGTSVGAVTGYTFGNVSSDHWIEAKFAASTGGLAVYIEPEDAKADGRWRADGGAWKNSGQVINNLAPGNVTVEFKDIDGWKTPEPVKAKIVAGKTTEVTGTYTDLVRSLPKIHYFTANPSPIGEGDPTRLEWLVANADSVSIDNGVGEGLDSAGGKTVTLNRTTTFTLTATNDFGSRKAEITVEVMEKPSVQWFTTDVSEDDPAYPGQDVRLNWCLEAAQTATLMADGDPGSTVEIDPEHGTLAVNPQETTLYTLTAVNSVGEATAELEVVVNQAPSVIAFAAAPEKLIAGEQTEFSWQVEGADSLEITPGLGTINPKKTSVAYIPNASGEFTLTATNEAGSDSATVSVTVVEADDAADLAVEILEIGSQAVAAEADENMVGDPIPVKIKLTNVGASAAKRFFVNLSDGDYLSDRISLIKLAAGDSAVRTLNYMPIEPGNRKIAVAVDPDLAVAEADRNNNSAKASVRIIKKPGPDLLVSDVRVSKADDGAPDDAVVVEFNVRNVGRAKSAGFQFRAHLGAKAVTSVRDGNLLIEDNVESLKPGESVHVVRAARLGELRKRFFLIIEVDTHLAINEENETNNNFTQSYRAKKLQ